MIAAFLPAAAIGKTLNFTLGAGKNMTVVGVVEDSRFRSVRERVLPMVFLFDRNQLPVLLLRFEETNPRGVRKQVETVWRRFEEFDTSDPPDGLAEDYFATVVEDFLATGIGSRGAYGAAPCVLVEAKAIVPFAVSWIERAMRPRSAS